MILRILVTVRSTVYSVGTLGVSYGPVSTKYSRQGSAENLPVKYVVKPIVDSLLQLFSLLYQPYMSYYSRVLSPS